MLKGKTVVLGVTGSIAAYKIANLASMLVKKHANVHVIMTENACNFINPITFETLTGNKCLVDTFDRNFQFNVEHVSLAKLADIFLVAPASADVIGKIANGIADDMLTTTIMACKCPKLISPAMNTNMFTNPIVQDNLKKLEHYGYEIIQPDSGYLACGDTGAGKMPSEQVLLNYILRTIAKDKDMAGIKLTVTAGPTREEETERDLKGGGGEPGSRGEWSGRRRKQQWSRKYVRHRHRSGRYRICVKKEHCKGNVSGGSRCSETRLEGHGCLRAHQYGYDPGPRRGRKRL